MIRSEGSAWLPGPGLGPALDAGAGPGAPAVLGLGQPAVPLGLEELGRLVRSYLHVEGRLFALLGERVAAVAEPQAKMMLSAHGYHHAWHAELWQEHLPVTPGAASEGRDVAGDPRLEGFWAAWAEPGGAGSSVELLAATYRVVVPRLVAAYSGHLDRARPVTDGPVIRALRLVLADEVADWREGERLVQWMLRTEEQVERAAAHQARLESILVLGGGLIAGGGDRIGRKP